MQRTTTGGGFWWAARCAASEPRRRSSTYVVSGGLTGHAGHHDSRKLRWQFAHLFDFDSQKQVAPEHHFFLNGTQAHDGFNDLRCGQVVAQATGGAR